MRFVAIPAARRFHVSAERAELRVEGVAVGAELVLVAGAADGRRLHAEAGRRGLLDGVRGVAVGADRRTHLAGRDRLAVHPVVVIGRDSRVAVAAGIGNVGLERGALRILAAENVVRAVAALAVGRNQQPFLGQRRSVDGIEIRRKDGGQPVLLGHAIVSVTRAAGLGNIQRIHRRPLVVLGEDGVRIAMTTGAGMVGCVGVDASREFRRLAGVAGIALDLRDLLRVGIFLDVGVTFTAFQAAVNALGEGLAIHADVMAGGILQTFVGVTGKTVGLRQGSSWSKNNQQQRNRGHPKNIPLRHSVMPERRRSG